MIQPAAPSQSRRRAAKTAAALWVAGLGLGNGRGAMAAAASATGFAAASAPAPSPPSTMGATHALLVAVDRPAALPQRLWLRGPDNDAALLRQVLLERGVAPEHITWLGRAPAANGPATHAGITSAMHSLLQRLKSGDHLVLHLAGHGLQVPQRPDAEPEPDGLDEVFLTADTHTWDAAQGVLPQALYDHDIARFVSTATQQGVRVLALFDTCHAAGLQRGAPGTPTRQRGVAAAELGVPMGATAPALSRVGSASPTGWLAAVAARRQNTAVPGAPVLALAARSHESTPEAWLPQGSAQARVHGVFSFAVAQALRAGTSDAGALRRALADAYAQAGRSTPVPMVLGEGPLLPASR